MIQFPLPFLSPWKRHISTICLFTVNHVANLAGSALCEVLFTKASLRDEVHDTEIVSDRTLLPKQVLADIPRKERENWREQTPSERKGINSFYSTLRSSLGKERFYLKTRFPHLRIALSTIPPLKPASWEEPWEKQGTANIKHYCYTYLYLCSEYIVF